MKKLLESLRSYWYCIMDENDEIYLSPINLLKIPMKIFQDESSRMLTIS